LTKDALPEDVLQFLHSCIDSVEQLRVLMLLYSDHNRIWTTAEITAELRSTSTSIACRLEALYERNVLVRSLEKRDGHQFRPGTPEVREVIQHLVEENQRKPFRIIDAIYSRPNKTLQAFADAFKLRGGKS
jgi:hypothetical protein